MTPLYFHGNPMEVLDTPDDPHGRYYYYYTTYTLHKSMDKIPKKGPRTDKQTNKVPPSTNI